MFQPTLSILPPCPPVKYGAPTYQRCFSECVRTRSASYNTRDRHCDFSLLLPLVSYTVLFSHQATHLCVAN